MTVPSQFADSPEGVDICFNCPHNDCIGDDRKACPLRCAFEGIEPPKPESKGLSPRTLAALGAFSMENIVRKAVASCR